MSGLQVFPFYLLCDTSKSMSGERIAAVNDGLPEIQNEILQDPIIEAKAFFSVISFSTEARVDLPLRRVGEVQSMPVLKAGGQTNYSRGIALARQAIEDDVNNLKSTGYQVIRPCVYFITDGRPGDSWKKQRDAWVNRSENKFAPNIIGFGVANADEDTLRRLATQFSFIASENVSPAVALREVMRHVTRSIVATARSTEMTYPIPRSDEFFRVVQS